MAERKKLGDLLKEAGLIDDFQIEAALSHQRNWGGEVWGHHRGAAVCREEDIARVVSEKMGVPYINLFEPELSPDIFKVLKADMAKKFGVVPVRKEANTLVLAMSDPLDIETMDNIRSSRVFPSNRSSPWPRRSRTRSGSTMTESLSPG